MSFRQLLIACALVLSPSAAGVFGQSSVPGYEGQARQIIDGALETYRSLSSYQDEMTLRVEQELKQPDPQMPSEPMEETSKLAFERPNKLALVTPGYSVYSNGNTLWEYAPILEQYVVGNPSQPLNLDNLEIAKFNVYAQYQHRIARLLAGEAPDMHAMFGGEVVKLDGVRSETIDGRAANVVRGVVRIQTAFNETQDVPVKACFDETRKVMVRLFFDHSGWISKKSAGPGMGPGMKITKLTETWFFRNVRVNEEIPADRFKFDPGRYDEKVTTFRPLSMEQMQQRMVGRPAPDFSGEDLEGKSLKLSDYRGKVVLLDFWAIWCQYCLIGMPSIQKLADEYKDSEFVVLGINTDGPGAVRQAKRFLRDQKIEFRHLADPAGKVASDYRVNSFPTKILIGKQGRVQAIHPGLSPVSTLKSEVDALVKGKSLAGGRR
jgi:peroxiredoxin/outer membrane lipoprotein-sorting protein